MGVQVASTGSVRLQVEADACLLRDDAHGPRPELGQQGPEEVSQEGIDP